MSLLIFSGFKILLLFEPKQNGDIEEEQKRKIYIFQSPTIYL